MIREGMTVLMAAGMIVFSPESILSLCPERHVVHKFWSGEIFSEMIHLFVLNSCTETGNFRGLAGLLRLLLHAGELGQCAIWRTQG